MRFSGRRRTTQFFDLEWIVIRGLILLISGEEICAGPGAAQVEVHRDLLLSIARAGGTGPGEVIRSQLYHTQALDGVMIAGLVGCLLAPATAACLVPALRALRIDPMQAPRTK